MRLSSLIAALVVLLLTILFFPLACNRIDAGYVGIKINNVGSEKGVQNVPLQTGYVWYNRYTQRVFEYPAYVQRVKWTKEATEDSEGNESVTASSREGSQFEADIACSVKLVTAKIPTFYAEYRQPFEQFLDGILRDTVRDEMNKVGGRTPFESIYGPGKEQYLAEVEDRVRKRLAPVGVEFRDLNFIGNIRPQDQRIMETINAKIMATQRAIAAENELRQVQAEAAKRVAQAEGTKNERIAVAQGEAEANRLLTASLTGTLIEWRRLEIERAAIEKWKGEVPTTVMGGGASPVPFINMTPGQR